MITEEVHGSRVFYDGKRMGQKCVYGEEESGTASSSSICQSSVALAY
jgi:hypothetical protein